MSGAIVIGNNNIIDTGVITQHAQTYLKLGVYNTASENTLVTGTLTGDPSYAGATWFNISIPALRYWDGTTVQTVTSGINGYVNGGNSFGSATTLGTKDNSSLSFLANNSAAMTILPSGNVGIGTTSPTSKLQVSGGSIVADSVANSAAYINF